MASSDGWTEEIFNGVQAGNLDLLVSILVHGAFVHHRMHILMLLAISILNIAFIPICDVHRAGIWTRLAYVRQWMAKATTCGMRPPNTISLLHCSGCVPSPMARRHSPKRISLILHRLSWPSRYAKDAKLFFFCFFFLNLQFHSALLFCL